MAKWCNEHPVCEIHEYPHPVVPDRDLRYKKGHVYYRNSLAAYYEFGLQFFEPEEWIVKIDGDQVYIRSQLQKTLDYIRKNGRDDILYGMRGYNTFVFKNKLVKYALLPINGGDDHYLAKRKLIAGFIQTELFEIIQRNIVKDTVVLPGMHWFHYLKAFKNKHAIRPIEDAQPYDIKALTPDEQKTYQTEVQPFFPETSPYATITY